MFSIKEQQIGTEDLPARWTIGVDRRHVALYIGLAVIAGFALGFVAAKYTASKEQARSITPAEAAEVPARNLAATRPSTEFHRVTRIVRGDTIEVDGNGVVRMIGLETPDGKAPREIYGTHGQNALSFTEKSLLGQEVRLEFDPAYAARENKDDQGVTLAYIYLRDGTLFNREMIRQGHAFMLANEPFQYVDDFRTQERDAVQASRGVWGPGGTSPLTASGQTPSTTLPGTNPLDAKKRLSPLSPSELGPNIPALSGSTPSGSLSSSEPSVFVSSADRMYHKSGCEYLDKRKQPKLLSQARSEGYTACSRCFASTLLKAP